MIDPNVPIPQSLPLLLNTGNSYKDEILAKILKGGMSHRDIILNLQRCWKIKIWFSKPIDIAVWTPCRLPTTLIKTDCHVFNKMWPIISWVPTVPISWDNRLAEIPKPDMELQYCPRRNSSYGYKLLDCFIEKITRYEILPDKVKPIWS